jgi:hypothetical protein
MKFFIAILRIIRGFIGFIMALQVVHIVEIFLNVMNEKIEFFEDINLGMLTIKILVMIISFFAFKGLRKLINKLYEKEYGYPHSTLSINDWAL